MKSSFNFTRVWVLGFLLLGGCSGGGRVNVTTPPAAPEPIEQASEAEVARRINAGEAGLDEGLKRMSQLLNRMDQSDAHNDPIENALLPAEIQIRNAGTVASIAQAVASLKKGDAARVISFLVGQSTSAESRVGDRNIDDVFSQLSHAEDLRHRDAMNQLELKAQPGSLTSSTETPADAFLIQSVVLQKDQRFYLQKSVQTYFLKRIQNQTEEMLKAEWNAELQLPSDPAPLSAPGTCPETIAMGAQSFPQFDFDTVSAFFLNEYEIPMGLQMRANALLSQMSGLSEMAALFKGSDENEMKVGFENQLLSALYLPLHLADFRRTEDEEDDSLISYNENPSPKQKQARKYVLGGGSRALLIYFLSSGGFNKKENQITSRLIQNSIENARALIGVTQSESNTFSDIYLPLQSLVDRVNILFDQVAERYFLDRVAKCAVGGRLSRWSELTDNRIYHVLRAYRDWLVAAGSSMQSRELFAALISKPAHPLTEIYQNRSLIRLNWEGPFQQVKLNVIPPSQILEEVQKREKAFALGVAQGVFPALPPVTVFPNGANPATAPTAEDLQLGLYLKEYYAVEEGRYFLEEDTARSGPVADSNDPRITVYRATISHLKNALQIRYQEKIKKDGSILGTPDVESPCIKNKGVSVDPLIIPLCNLHQELEAQESNGTLEFHYKHDKIHLALSPGIYQTDLNVDLHVLAMDFHPLSLIQIPGKKLRILSKDALVQDPWIDVSSLDAPEDLSKNGNTASTQIERDLGVDNTLSTVVCRLVERWGDDDYANIVFGTQYEHGMCVGAGGDKEHDCMYKTMLDGHIYKYGKSGDPRETGEYRQDEWKFCQRFTARGRAPYLPRQADVGRGAGSIYLGDPEKTEIGFGLLVALGGDGMPGFQGSDSPLCKTEGNGNRVYQTPMQSDPFWAFNPNGKSEKDEYDKVREGSWKNQPPLSHDPAYDIASGPGGQGGDASAGGNVEIGNSPLAVVPAVLIAAGRPGNGGAHGACGPSNSIGAVGRPAQPGNVKTQ